MDAPEKVAPLTEKTLDDLEKMPEYQVGLWYSPHVKVYSIGGSERVAEISNYPRAYKDTTPHVYTKDTPFTVAEEDLNHEENGERFYMDSKEDLYRLGEKATHWRGDSLPGAFPLWIESGTLPYTPDTKNHIFPIDKIPAPTTLLIEADIKVADDYVPLRDGDKEGLSNQLDTDVVSFPKLAQDQDKQIIRVMYRRARR